MPVRTVLTAQNLATIGIQPPFPASPSAPVTFQNIDPVNGMQTKNTDNQVVLIKTGIGESLTVTFVSQPDQVPASGLLAPQFGRKGDVTTIVPSNTVMAFGPFAPSRNWGDGSAQLFIDFGASTGNPQIAVISIVTQAK